MKTSKLNRRSFIGLGATAVAGMAFPSLIVPPQKEKLGVALLGLGSYSKYQLAPALQQTGYCQLSGIVTGSPDKIPSWQKKYSIPDKNVYSYDTIDQIANNDDIDVIYIVTPTGTHADFTIRAAETGKHVWCEKPMAMDVEECQNMIEACQKNRVGLTIGYRVQHEPNTLTLNSYASSLPFGKRESISATAGYNGGGGGYGWRFQKNMGGGALYDMGVYTVNGMRSATQLEPIEILSAKQSTKRPGIFKEVDETTEYELLFPNGIKGSGKTSVGEGMNHLRVSCERGWYELRPMQTYSGVRGSRSDGQQLDAYLPNQQAHQMDEDAYALLNGHQMKINPKEGLKDIRVIEAIIQSSETGMSVKI